MAGGISHECGKWRVRGGLEIGPGDGDPFDVGLEDSCGHLRRQLLYAHRLGAPAAAQLHLPSGPSVVYPPDWTIRSDQPALPVLLD
jgi:hypothetical protein